MGLDIGLVLYNLRKENKSSQREVCKDICAVSNYSKIETGDIIPDIFSLAILCERLGFDTLGLTAYICKTDAEYWKWKRHATRLARLGKFEELKEHFKQKPKKKTSLNKHLMNQFELFIEAIILEKVEKDYRQALVFYQRAIDCTCKELLVEDRITGIYSQTEIGLVLQYLRCLAENNENEYDYVSARAYSFIEYLNTRHWDSNCKLKIYAQLVVFWTKYDKRNRNMDSKYYHLKSVYNQLQSTNYLYEMINILSYLVTIGKAIGMKADIYEKYLQFFLELYQELDIPFSEPVFEVYNDQLVICIVGDYIKKARKCQKQSQQSISEGICSVESYSRMENGRNIQRNNYSAISEKLEIDERYYLDLVKTNNVAVLQIRKKIANAFCADNYDEAEKYLNELVDLLEEKNQQYVLYNRAKINHGKRLLSEKQYYDALCYAFSQDGDISEIEISNHSFTILEISIIDKIAGALHHMGEDEQAVYYLKALLKNIEADEALKEINYVSVCRVKLNLARYLTDIDRMEEARELFMQEMKEALGRKLFTCHIYWLNMGIRSMM